MKKLLKGLFAVLFTLSMMNSVVVAQTAPTGSRYVVNFVTVPAGAREFKAFPDAGNWLERTPNVDRYSFNYGGVSGANLGFVTMSVSNTLGWAFYSGRDRHKTCQYLELKTYSDVISCYGSSAYTIPYDISRDYVFSIPNTSAGAYVTSAVNVSAASITISGTSLREERTISATLTNSTNVSTQTNPAYRPTAGEGTVRTWTIVRILGTVATTTAPVPVDPGENACLTPEGKPLRFATGFPVADHTSTVAPGSIAKYPGMDCKFYAGMPPGETVGVLCIGPAFYGNGAAGGKSDQLYRWCMIYSDGTKFDPEQQATELSETDEIGHVEEDVPTAVGALPNGTVLNVELQKKLKDYALNAAFDQLCDGTVTFCVKSEDKILMTTRKNGCMTKSYWHDGNVSGNGHCISAYDRDWPNKEEPYAPEKAWKWEEGPAATQKDISDGKLSTISPTTGKPVTAGSAAQNGTVVIYPPSAGGGNSSTNPGDPNGSTAPISTPNPNGGGTGAGNGFWKSQYPDGLDGWWGDFSGQINGTPLFGSLEGFKFTGTPSSAPLCWTFHGLNDVEANLCIENKYLALLKALVIIAAIFTARRIVVGA